MKTLALLLLAATAAPSWDQLWYPFGPWRDPVAAETAAAFRARLERKGGIALALRRVCASDMRTAAAVVTTRTIRPGDSSKWCRTLTGTETDLSPRPGPASI